MSLLSTNTSRFPDQEGVPKRSGLDPRDAQKSWVFEWVPGGWKACGVSWHTPGDGWLVAHDVFHHRPTDQGSFAEELASYGAEEWIETLGNPQVPRDQSARDLSESLYFVLEASAPDLDLPPPPPPAPCQVMLSKARLSRLRAGFEEAVSMWYVSDHRRMPEAQWAILDEPAYLDRVLAWIRHGWHQASLRHPDPEQAAIDYRQLAETVDAATAVERAKRLNVTWAAGQPLRVEWHTPRATSRPRPR